jgi:Cd2+/Zn2+-exporting ATPase
MGVSGMLQANGSEHESHLGRRSLFSGSGWIHGLAEPDIGITEAVLESGGVRGRILLKDEVRTSSGPLLKHLAGSGLQLTMLSGDRQEAAISVARQVGLQEVLAGLDPQHKVDQIRAWTAAGERVAMIGDGVNDAPSLAAAHVGVAMGLRGSDTALEQADVVLTQDRLERFFIAYQISRKARRVIRQNLAISLGSVAVLVVAAFAGWIPLTVAVIGHEGSTVVVVLNSLRLLMSDYEDQGGPQTPDQAPPRQSGVNPELATHGVGRRPPDEAL